MSINARSAADLYAKRDGREPDLLFRMRARADHRQVCRCRRCAWNGGLGGCPLAPGASRYGRKFQRCGGAVKVV
jgi:hypothetical protein